MAEEAKRWCNDVCIRIWLYLLNQASQPSTYRGLILIATAAGINVAPQMTEVIITIGLMLAGIIGAAVPDSIKKNDQ